MKLVRMPILLKSIVIAVSLLLVQGGIELQAENGPFEKELIRVVNIYNAGRYTELIPQLEKLLNQVGEEQRVVRGSFFLLLGAAYEQTGNKDKAVENYLLGDLLLDKPAVKGVDLRSLKVFNNTIYGKLINGKRVFEKVGKRKKKKKFPYLAIAGVAAIVIAVLFLLKKKTQDQPEDLSGQYAREILNEIEWVEIPAGEFLMGDHTGTGEPHERPVHKVYLDSYRISKYEITVRQYRRFTEVNPTLNVSYDGNGDNFPVTSVNLAEAELFCNWMTEETRKLIIIPTEAQWEKAARGTDQRIYPWGNEPPECSRLNYNNCMGVTAEIGSFPNDISFYSVMDMGGNVAEWVSDGYEENYYSISPYSNPTGPENQDTQYRIIRGGHFSADSCRAAERNLIERFRGRNSIGFRVVRQ